MKIPALSSFGQNDQHSEPEQQKSISGASGSAWQPAFPVD
jgi:hypothetical protein